MLLDLTPMLTLDPYADPYAALCRYAGFRTAVKVLSGCECWSFTLSLKKEINPAKTSFNFDFNLLGLGTQKSSVN